MRAGARTTIFLLLPSPLQPASHDDAQEGTQQAQSCVGDQVHQGCYPSLLLQQANGFVTERGEGSEPPKETDGQEEPDPRWEGHSTGGSCQQKGEDKTAQGICRQCAKGEGGSPPVGQSQPQPVASVGAQKATQSNPQKRRHATTLHRRGVGQPGRRGICRYSLCGTSFNHPARETPLPVGRIRVVVVEAISRLSTVQGREPPGRSSSPDSGEPL